MRVRKLRLEHYQQDNDWFILAGLVYAYVSIRVFIPAYRVHVVLESTCHEGAE